MKICATILDTRHTMDDPEALAIMPRWCTCYVLIQSFKWCDDFAAARNYCLEVAQSTESDWMLMLDTDMRYSGNPDYLLQILQDESLSTIHLWDVSQTYHAPRLFRLPAKGKFVGRTHEYYDDSGAPHQVVDGVTFEELDKTPEQLSAKLARDVRLLKEQIRHDRFNGRWHYYLGDTYDNQGEHDKAIKAFGTCSIYSSWDEERAWSEYRIAKILCVQQKYHDALFHCNLAIQKCPRIAEVYWLAGFCTYYLQRYYDAIAYANCAIALGYGNMVISDLNRTGFRELLGLMDGPYDVLHHTYRVLGYSYKADMYNHKRIQLAHDRDEADKD